MGIPTSVSIGSMVNLPPTARSEDYVGACNCKYLSREKPRNRYIFARGAWGRPCSSVRRRRCPGLCAFFFYPRPLRSVRASALPRKAPTARQPTAHTGDRPRPPLPTGPPSSLSHLISQRDARASTKQSTPGPQPRSRSLSGANRSPSLRRPVGTP